MTQPTTEIAYDPTMPRIVPDLFGITIHLNGTHMYVNHEHVDRLLLALADFQVQHDHFLGLGWIAKDDTVVRGVLADLERTAGE